MAKKIFKLTDDDLSEIVKETINEAILHNAEPLNEMARIRQLKSGLPMIVWLVPDDGSNNIARLKFQDNTNTRLIMSDLVPISIDSTNPQILVKNYTPKLPAKSIAMLKKWIIKNYSVLMSYWNNEIYEDEIIDKIRPL